MYAKFHQKILNCMVVGALQSFQFFRQIAWFLRINRVLSKFRYRILHYGISIIKLLKKSVRESQFCINHASHLIWKILRSETRLIFD